MDPGELPSPIVVLGSTTCEDTAIVTSRLRALGVPFRDVDIDTDPAAARRVASLNNDQRITPTVVAGDDATVESEPTLEALGRLLAAAGHDAVPPRATQYHGELITRPIPIRHLNAVGRGSFSLDEVRGRQQVALFLGHGAGCLACFGYARQLAARRAALAEADGRLVVVVTDDTRSAAGWRHGIDEQVMLLADPGGSWKRAVATHVGAPPHDALLLVLDRFGAPRAGSMAGEAGGLVDPSEAVEWLQFLALECPECSGELPWPAST